MKKKIETILDEEFLLSYKKIKKDSLSKLLIISFILSLIIIFILSIIKVHNPIISIFKEVLIYIFLFSFSLFFIYSLFIPKKCPNCKSKMNKGYLPNTKTLKKLNLHTNYSYKYYCQECKIYFDTNIGGDS